MRTSTSEAGGDPAALAREVKARALSLGFDLCRILRASDAVDQSEALSAWLASGAQGDMDWMASTRARRAHPHALWPLARSIVVVGLNYGPKEDPLKALAAKRAGAISVYARNRDYHDVMKGRLKLLAGWLVGRCGAEVKVFVDTAPVMEKPLAQAAGLGWQGKHTNLVSREFGSWLFLGSLFAALDLEPDAPETDHCGGCRACLDACPTRAFPAPHRIDARRCVSYLTIEHRGHIPHELREAIGNRVYGCDDCLAVCPWNKFARAGRETKLQARDDLESPDLGRLARLDDAGFRRLFAGGPVKRIGLARFLRNVMIAIGNSQDASLAPAALARTRDDEPIVRAAAIWAFGRLSPAEEAASLARALLDGESDPQTRDELLRLAPECAP